MQVCITMISKWPLWRLKSPAFRFFAQPFVQGQIKGNIKAPCRWHWWPVDSPHKGPVTRKVFRFDDVITVPSNVLLCVSTDRLTDIHKTSYHTGTGTIKAHDDVIKWKYFPCYWSFVRGIHLSPLISPHKGQWRGALMCSLICPSTKGWVNNRDAGDLRRHRAHYDVMVMKLEE